MIGENLTLDKFLHSAYAYISVDTPERWDMHTLIVNRLYGNIRGIKLKKLSLYSFNLIALSATVPSIGRIPGGNLPFGSQFSAKHVPHVMRENVTKHAGRYAPFEIAALRSSIAASRSGWNGCCK